MGHSKLTRPTTCDTPNGGGTGRCPSRPTYPRQTSRSHRLQNQPNSPTVPVPAGTSSRENNHPEVPHDINPPPNCSPSSHTSAGRAGALQTLVHILETYTTSPQSQNLSDLFPGPYGEVLLSLLPSLRRMLRARSRANALEPLFNDAAGILESGQKLTAEDIGRFRRCLPSYKDPERFSLDRSTTLGMEDPVRSALDLLTLLRCELETPKTNEFSDTSAGNRASAGIVGHPSDVQDVISQISSLSLSGGGSECDASMEELKLRCDQVAKSADEFELRTQKLELDLINFLDEYRL